MSVITNIVSDVVFQIPSKQLKLLESEVHVWRVNLQDHLPNVSELFAALSDDEKQRAQRFYFERDRHHFIIARSMLRKVLAGYLSEQPHALEFSYGQYGKPNLDNVGGSLQFSVTHAKGLALFAIILDKEVGIDVECMREDVDIDGIAKRFFAVEEQQALNQLPVEQKLTGFFKVWACKEAYLKAKGSGLSSSMQKFAVNADPRLPASLIKTQDDLVAMKQWSLQVFAPELGYAAALAVNGKFESLSFWQVT